MIWIFVFLKRIIKPEWPRVLGCIIQIDCLKSDKWQPDLLRHQRPQLFIRRRDRSRSSGQLYALKDWAQELVYLRNHRKAFQSIRLRQIKHYWVLGEAAAWFWEKDQAERQRREVWVVDEGQWQKVHRIPEPAARAYGVGDQTLVQKDQWRLLDLIWGRNQRRHRPFLRIWTAKWLWGEQR